MIVSYAVSDSEEERENEPGCDFQVSKQSVSVLSQNAKEGNSSSSPKNTNSLLPESSSTNNISQPAIKNRVKDSPERSSLSEDETSSLPLTFSTQIEDMLSGLPPPKRKKVTASESFLSSSLVSASLTSLTKKNLSNKIDLAKQTNSSDFSKNNSAKVVDSDDSDTETSGDNVTQKTAVNSDDSVEGTASGLRFESALLSK